MMREKTDVVIIGAGVSGCTAAQELQANGIDYLLLEQNVEPGGLTRSISIGDDQFDYTGHFLHLSRYESPAAIPYAKQNNRDWQTIERNSVVYTDGAIVPAPFQYNIAALPESTRQACIKSYRTRPTTAGTDSLKDYLLSGFGEEICRAFLFPYHEKQMATSLDDFSSEAITRFFPPPDEQKIELGFMQQNAQPACTYNSAFWYPRKEGIGLLVKGLASGLTGLRTSCRVQKIDTRNKCIYTSQGKMQYNHLLSSMPLKNLCLVSDDSNLRANAPALRHNRVLCLNFGIDGQFCRDFGKCHWVYVPDRSAPFYRLGFYSHFKLSPVPSGRTTGYIEVSISDDAPKPQIREVLNTVFASLENLGWIADAKLDVISANWIDCAYVHFNKSRKSTLRKVFDLLHAKDIHCIGRYGLWDYISMEDSMISAIQTAKTLTGRIS